MTAIELRQVEKHYRDGRGFRRVVDKVDLIVEEGSMTLIMGPSGCGKTTLLSLIGGMVNASGGDILLFGESIVRLRDAHRTALRRQRLGFVFQDLALVPAMTVRENLLLPWVPLGFPPRAILASILKRAETFGIAPMLDRNVKTLSGGERQRTAIVRALAFDAPILLLDEPSAHLDSDNTAKLAELLLGLKAEGKTIVLSTHDPRLTTLGTPTRMRDGRIEDSGGT